MAGKKKATKGAAKDLKLHQEVIKQMVASVDQGEGHVGYTYAEMRTACDIKSDNEDFAKIPSVMSELRDWGFLNHHFINGTLYRGNPADIPNLLKRGDPVLQLVFFLTPDAMKLVGGEDELANRVNGEALEWDVDADDTKNSITRESISGFYNGLADIIDTYSTDPAFVALAARHIQALKPS